jgi:competence protein ComEC
LRALGLIFCVLGFLINKPIDQKICIEPEFFQEKATVTSMPMPSSSGFRCEIASEGASYEMRYQQPQDLCLGDSIQVTGVVYPPSEIREKLFESKHLKGVLRPKEDGLVCIQKGWLIWKRAADWRSLFLRWTSSTLGNQAAIADALCFNVDAELDSDLRENLQRTGTIHIISASGIHVLIFAFALQWLLTLLPLPRWMVVLLVGVVIGLYAAAAGLKPPIVRSAIMSLVLLSAFIFRREGDLLSALAACALGYLVFEPTSLNDIGFQLSFINVAALALFVRPIRSQATSVHRLIFININIIIRASCVASIASAPVVAYHFGAFSIISPIANLVIGWAISIIVVVCMIGSVLHIVASSVCAGLMLMLVRPLIGWVSLSVGLLGSWSLASIEVPTFSAYWLIPIYGLLLMTWRKHVRQA